MSKLFYLADILGSSISFSWRRLLFFCVSSALLRLERSMFRFKLDPSVLYFLSFFQMVILVGETLFRKRCSKCCWTSLKLLVLSNLWLHKLRCIHVSCILVALKNEWIVWWQSGFIYILMVPRLQNNIRETLITFKVNLAETALLSKDFLCMASTLLIPFT